jgi:hypothetical protein
MTIDNQLCSSNSGVQVSPEAVHCREADPVPRTTWLRTRVRMPASFKGLLMPVVIIEADWCAEFSTRASSVSHPQLPVSKSGSVSLTSNRLFCLSSFCEASGKAMDSGNSLFDVGILDAVLGCLEGEGIFVCSVCKLWRASWQGKGGGGGGKKKKRRLLRSRLSSNSTSYAAAFASAARFSLALEGGMSLNGCSQDEVERCAGRYADIATLKEAHRLGMRWTDSVLAGAAESNDVSKLIWLRDAQEVVFPKLSIELAVAAGSIDALRWLKQQEAFRDDPLPQYDCSWLQARPQLTWRRSPLTTFSLGDKMSYTAASKAGNLPMLRYLHEEGCPWHYDTCGVAAASGDLEQLN